ncbi:MAG: T9SS type A sorting domain-containing protein, partial [Bacteroidota bacterium]|nr:T9SS type A sorting domain-containing protein [Candidatus Kapabacteria bacterium]MDW8221044.1 T9SS type A sorting domain-containing protein [Bacteroidota bacterium]
DSIQGHRGDIRAMLGETIHIPSGIAGRRTRYEWLKNGVVLHGATSATLILLEASARDAGTYICRATNSLIPNLTLVTRAVHVSITGAIAQALPKAELQFPISQAINVAPRPQLQWSRVRGADAYTIVIAQDRRLTRNVQRIVVEQSQRGDSVVVAWASAERYGTILERGAEYFWSVQAISWIEGVRASWSDTASFRVVPFGQNIAVSSVHFGRVTIGDTAKAFGALVNVSDEDLRLESVAVEGSLERAFAVHVPERSILPANTSLPFVAVFKPDRTDTLRASLVVRYTDSKGQGIQSVRLERALIGHGGALALRAVDFDTVRVGKSMVRSIQIENRSGRAVAISSITVRSENGTGEHVFSIATPQRRVDALILEPGDTVFVPLRCLSLAQGMQYGIVSVISESERLQANIKAFARLARPDDASVSLVASANPVSAPPGTRVYVHINIENYSEALRQRLINAARPEVHCMLRFDRQVLIPEGRDVRLLQGTSDSAVVLVNTAWEGRSGTIAVIPFRAVAGTRRWTRLEIINAHWGGTSANERAEWEQKVFVEESDSVGVFNAHISTAGGRRFITMQQARAPLAMLSVVHPNPASDIVNIIYTLFDESNDISLDILNVKGEIVQAVHSAMHCRQGEYRIVTNVRMLSAGAYIVRLRAGNTTVSQRLDIYR